MRNCMVDFMCHFHFAGAWDIEYYESVSNEFMLINTPIVNIVRYIYLFIIHVSKI